MSVLSSIGLILTVLAEVAKTAAAWIVYKAKTYLPEKIDALDDLIFELQEEIDRETLKYETGDTIRLRYLNSRLLNKQKYRSFLVSLSSGEIGSSKGNTDSN